jgi:hypothetical protein
MPMLLPNEDLFRLELDLAKYPEGEKGSAANRRMILRKAMYQQGYTDGHRDSSEADHIEREIRRKRGLDNEDDAVFARLMAEDAHQDYDDQGRPVIGDD